MAANLSFISIHVTMGLIVSLGASLRVCRTKLLVVVVVLFSLPLFWVLLFVVKCEEAANCFYLYGKISTVAGCAIRAQIRP